MGIYRPESCHLFAHVNVFFLRLISSSMFWSLFGGKTVWGWSHQLRPCDPGGDETLRWRHASPREGREPAQPGQPSLIQQSGYKIVCELHFGHRKTNHLDLIVKDSLPFMCVSVFDACVCSQVCPRSSHSPFKMGLKFWPFFGGNIDF